METRNCLLTLNNRFTAFQVDQGEHWNTVVLACLFLLFILAIQRSHPNALSVWWVTVLLLSIWIKLYIYIILSKVNIKLQLAMLGNSSGYRITAFSVQNFFCYCVFTAAQQIKLFTLVCLLAVCRYSLKLLNVCTVTGAWLHVSHLLLPFYLLSLL